MKKIYLSVFALSVLTFNSTAQKAVENYQFSTAPTSQNAVPTNTPKDIGAEIWSNNFDDTLDWTTDNDTQTGATFGWNVDATSDGWWSTGGINSTSGGNFAEVGNGNPTTTPATQALGVAYTITTAASIDIPNLPANTSNTDNAILQFEEFGARFYDNQEVQISTDNSTWVTVRDNSGYDRLSEENPDNSYANPETVSVNISPYIDGNASTVWIRFSWTSEFPTETNPDAWIAYGWYIDDVKILTQPVDDVQILNSYFVGTTNEGVEYGRTPVSNLDASYVVGSTVYNFGSVDQPTAFIADFGTFIAATTSLIKADSTEQVETTETPALPVGVYTGAYSIVSSTDTVGGLSGADNVDSRTFEVTNNVYSLDGIGVYPTTSLSSIGTDSFIGGEDGLIVAAMYHIKSNTVINNLQVMLATGTVAGGIIFGSIIDTTVLLNNGTTPLHVADPVEVTAADISAGFINVPFAGGITLFPGAYYAAVELTSNSGSNTIRIADDETVAQPGIASMIYIPAPTALSYSYGTAVGIRLVTAALSVAENQLEGVSVYPNPSEGMVTISNDNNSSNDIVVYNMLGETIYTASSETKLSVDLSAVGAGVYLVKVSNESGSIVERVVIR